MDQHPTQIVSHSRFPLSMRRGGCPKVNYECVREGMCNAFMFVQLLDGWREVHVSKMTKSARWTNWIQWLVDLRRFPRVQGITLVCDELNARYHEVVYAASARNDAFRIQSKLVII